MKRFIQAAFSLLMFLVLASSVAGLLYEVAGVPPVATGVAAIVLTFVRAYVSMRSFDKAISNDRYKHFMSGRHIVYQNAPQVEIWAKYIMGAIFRNNQFLTYCFNADDNVLAGKVVHIPQAGGTSTVVKNRSSLPAAVTKRTDTDITYALDEFTTDPRLIPNADTVELSYDKMNSVMSDDMNALRQTVADNILIAWAPETNIIRTTGDDVATHLAGTTGFRKKLRAKDVLAAQTFLNTQDAPMEGRYALISAVMYSQLVEDLSESQYRDFSRSVDEKTGVVGMLYGFKIMMRSRVFTYDNSGTPVVNAYAAAADVDDNDAALFWHENAVERAMGEIKVFDQSNSPQYYGDLMAFLMRMGGRIRREDENGVLALVQEAA